jgi:tetratricopeptide (TPR) repeat protein
VKLAVLATLVAATGLASAQPRRYPSTPTDTDDELQRKSKLWEAATNPQRSPYDALIAEAQQLLEDRTAESARDAIGKLDAAIALMVGESIAYRLRAEAALTLKDWPRCARDFAAAFDRLKRTDVELKSSADLRRRIGICLARSGKLAEAEVTLAEATASGLGTGELWMRLGEVRMAMGKLEEAIGALESALDYGDVATTLVRWLLSAAYDRARKPAQAVEAANRALAVDPDLAMLRANQVPLLGSGELEYLVGLASSLRDPPRSEMALMYFRRYLAIAPDSAWRRRAEDHVRELKLAELPEGIEKSSGNAPLDLAAARGVVRKVMPAMRQCLQKFPAIMLRVEVTRVGPRSAPSTPPTASAPRRPPRLYLPPEGVTILPHMVADDQTSKLDIDTAVRCVEPFGERVRAVLPAVADRDAYYKAMFYVVAP